jgi:hypothetical protein
MLADTRQVIREGGRCVEIDARGAGRRGRVASARYRDDPRHPDRWRTRLGAMAIVFVVLVVLVRRFTAQPFGSSRAKVNKREKLPSGGVTSPMSTVGFPPTVASQERSRVVYTMGLPSTGSVPDHSA